MPLSKTKANYLLDLHPLYDGLELLLANELAPIVNKIDQAGMFPESFFRQLAKTGGFKPPIEQKYGGFWQQAGGGLSNTIPIMAKISEYCLSTAFVYWCHSISTRYIQLSSNDIAKSRYLPDLLTGQLFGATGLSNPLKSISNIEHFLLSAKKVAGGYEVTGTLPWVSNIEQQNILVTACSVEGASTPMFFVTYCNAAGLSISQNAHFIALEGTRTCACHFRKVFVANEDVLAHPEHSTEFVKRIKPGMILSQIGMALGLISDCISLIVKGAINHAQINIFVDIQAEDLSRDLVKLQQEVISLAEMAESFPTNEIRENMILTIMQLRLEASELSLRASQAAMLHGGAKAYLKNSVAQRRLRESYFIAIVTPAAKHLRLEISKRQVL